MGTTGTPWFLPWPEGSERPSNAYDALFSLANSMDNHLSRWQTEWDRLKRRPAARLAYESSVRYVINKTALSTVQYNNVHLDTAGMTDLQKRGDRLYLPRSPRPALYMCGGMVVGLPSVLPSYPDIRLATNARFTLDTVPNPDVPYGYDTRDVNYARTDTSRGETFQVSTLVLAYQTVDGLYDDDIWVQIEINSGVDFTVWGADLYAFWATDIASIPFT